MKIGRKLILGFSIFVLSALVLGAASIKYGTDAASKLERTFFPAYGQAEAAVETAQQLQQVDALIGELFLQQDTGMTHIDNKVVGKIRKSVSRLQQLSEFWEAAVKKQENQKQLETLQSFKTQLDTLIAQLNRTLALRLQKGPASARSFYESKVQPSLLHTTQSFEQLSKNIEGQFINKSEQLREVLRKNTLTSIILIGIGLLGLIAFPFFVRRTISKPLSKLCKVATEAAKGQLGNTIKIGSNDEIGSLAKSFNDITSKLQESPTARSSEAHKHPDELSFAEKEPKEQIQDDSFPKGRLQRRVKHFNCFYGLSKLVEQPKTSLEQIFRETVHLIRHAYRHPDVTCARITFDGMQYKTENFEKSEVSQVAQIKVHGEKAGSIEIYYLGEKTQTDDEPVFLKEERELLDTVAEHLGSIAESKKSAEKLLLFRNLIDRSNDSIFVVEPIWGRLLDINEKACSSLGYTREELLDMSVKNIEQSKADDSAWTEYVEEIRKKGSMVSDALYKRSDGTTFPVEVNVNFISQGKQDYLIAVARDITERKKAEQALKRSELKFKTIFENAGGALFIADCKTGEVVDCNSEAEILLGRPRQEIIGMHQSDLHPDGESEKYKQKFAAHLEKDRLVDYEGEVQHRDGRRIPVWIAAQRISLGEDDTIIGLFVDITESKRAEENQAKLIRELQSTNEKVNKINQELKDFAYIVSHDLKAPLRGIKTLADWLSTDYADKFDETGKEQMDLLLGRVTRMHNLIDGVLRYSRVGRVEEKKSKVDLNNLMQEVIDMVAPPENIQVTIEEQLPVVECEKTCLVRVFENLLSNAIKYMDKPKGYIRIGCAEQDGFWKFSVSDNGPGIEEKHYERIFRIFQTLSPRDEFESTGVGLTVVKKSVELAGGKIWVESKLGEGSTFYFTLPKSKQEVQNVEIEANIAC